MRDALRALPTPCYVVDERALVRNLTVLKEVKEAAGCRILLAQKAFSMFAVYPLIGKYLDGTTGSGLYEARLGREEMGGETHAYSPAYAEGDFGEILRLCSHVTFNSLAQWERFGQQALAAGASCGLRVNPEHSTQQNPLYDPCAPFSRLGIPASRFPQSLPEGVEGLHFHTLCEQDSPALKETLAVFEEKFGPFIPSLKWVNFGGGHHITRADYDRGLLVSLVRGFREKYGVEVYLEPGEAIAYRAGYLMTTVLDIVHNGMDIAILDASASCHMPDVLEMPYRPPLMDSGLPGEKAYTYRLGGPTCLAGDVIGDYSFDSPLAPGDRLLFEDMAIYTMVKNNTFNGIPLPAIALLREDGTARVVKEFGYGDFKGRLS
ncbi:MAG TPA: carboxynorspermidine decarboxylase [Candidatus Limnocylindria bacterium]|nr:carboxynorspermidine decarboxylase [Candidatus Limnocylindria bacterium]